MDVAVHFSEIRNGPHFSCQIFDTANSKKELIRIILAGQKISFSGDFFHEPTDETPI